MLDTFNVQSTLRVIALLLLLAFAVSTSAQQDAAWRQAMQAAGRAAPQSRIIVLRLNDDHAVASRHLREAAVTLAAPGSTLKPIVLYEMLRAGIWHAGERVPCPGDLEIGGRRMACSHPIGPPFNASEALAWSCNAYFAQVARSIPPGDLARMLESSGLLKETRLEREEAVAAFRAPRSPQETQLAVLGVDGIRVTPLELAEAYRWLAQQLNAHAGSDAASTVQAGLADSAKFGVAKGATENCASVIGKTGTAPGVDSPRTHGWFAGLFPAEKPQFVVVVYLPAGHGYDAARVAGELLARAPVVR